MASSTSFSSQPTISTRHQRHHTTTISMWRLNRKKIPRIRANGSAQCSSVKSLSRFSRCLRLGRLRPPEASRAGWGPEVKRSRSWMKKSARSTTIPIRARSRTTYQTTRFTTKFCPTSPSFRARNSASSCFPCRSTTRARNKKIVQFSIPSRTLPQSPVSRKICSLWMLLWRQTISRGVWKVMAGRKLP